MRPGHSLGRRRFPAKCSRPGRLHHERHSSAFGLSSCIRKSDVKLAMPTGESEKTLPAAPVVEVLTSCSNPFGKDADPLATSPAGFAKPPE